MADPPRGASAADAKAAAASASRRCRHTTAGVGPLVFTCGGLRGGTLLGDMFVAEESPEEGGMTREEATARLAEVIDLAAPAWRRWLRDAGLEEEANRAIREADAASDVAGPEPLGSRAPDGKKKTTAAAPKGAAGGAFGTPQGGSFNAASPGSAGFPPSRTYLAHSQYFPRQLMVKNSLPRRNQTNGIFSAAPSHRSYLAWNSSLSLGSTPS